MITGYVLGSEKVVAKLEGFPPALRVALRKAVTSEVLKLQRHVVQNKLSGQVLHVRTGTLRRSVNIKMEQGDDFISGSVGTNIRYAKPHEYGGVVPEHNRLVTMVFGRPLKFPVWATVRAYSLPQRSFLRSSLSDRSPSIREALRDAVGEAVK